MCPFASLKFKKHFLEKKKKKKKKKKGGLTHPYGLNGVGSHPKGVGMTPLALLFGLRVAEPPPRPIRIVRPLSN
jgi:hypothetical protein